VFPSFVERRRPGPARRGPGAGLRRPAALLRRSLAAVAAAALAAALVPAPAAAQAAAPVRVVVDGRTLATDAAPFIDQGRTLVPLRAIFEALGAQVDWHPAERRVTAQRGSRSVRLHIGRRLACLDAACGSAALLDVPARIHQDRTFVPLRFVATALGAGVRWDAAARTVYIETNPAGVPDPGSGVAITEPGTGARITGPTRVQVRLDGDAAASAAEVRYFLLDPATGRGPIVARGSSPTAAYTWLPDPLHDGPRFLAAAVYDRSGRFLAGDVVPVTVAAVPQVALRGPAQGQVITGALELAADVNFVAVRVRYERVDPATGQAVTVAEGDPYGPLTWTPGLADNGPALLRAAAVDRLGREHTSPVVAVEIQVPRRLALQGVSSGARITRPVNLSASANFAVKQTRYILRDPGGAETVLASRDGTSSLRWIPSPDHNGSRQLLVEVTDQNGAVHRSAPVDVTVAVEPAIFLETVGPNQVLAGEVSLRATSTVPLTSIAYELVDGAGRARRIAGGSSAGATYTWRPAAGDAGNWRLRAVGQTAAGARVTSEAIPVRVYTGTLYGPIAAMPRSQFLDFASRLAVESYRKTGMSAALQVAQAILETGWGQSTPRDKYTGKVSNNLFGIKGTGPAGSVVSNTWEEYNGVAYRVDANFRAYPNLQASWDDHKRLLLEAQRYAPFRDVMHDPIRGAYALRRAGYATDSQYPAKLINLMVQHQLFRLDEVEP